MFMEITLPLSRFFLGAGGRLSGGNELKRAIIGICGA